MAKLITVPGPLVEFRAEKALTPGMQALVLRIGHAVDRACFHQEVTNAVWFELAAADVRGARDDNHWLRQWMRRLMAVQIEGNYRGQPWAAVLVAEWKIIDHGATLAVLVPPGAINALRAPETFAKVEEHCLLSLDGAARRLYLSLADKKRLKLPRWRFELDELRAVLGVADRKAYARWDHFRARVLDPAVARINDFGTVNVTMKPERYGRRVGAVTFEWTWKSLDEARESAEEAGRLRIARHEPRNEPREAPPLIEAESSVVAEGAPPREGIPELLQHFSRSKRPSA